MRHEGEASGPSSPSRLHSALAGFTLQSRFFKAGWKRATLSPTSPGSWMLLGTAPLLSRRAWAHAPPVPPRFSRTSCHGARGCSCHGPSIWTLRCARARLAPCRAKRVCQASLCQREPQLPAPLHRLSVPRLLPKTQGSCCVITSSQLSSQEM